MTSFKVNGQAVSVNVPKDTPLLWVVREELDLLGTKFGCGKGLCGACTTHLNGEPIRACLTPISAVEGQNLSTIEALSDGKGGLHPVQKAWQEFNVAQCGYCQSGQIMTAVALVSKPGPLNEEDIRSAMSGNLCRCGSYQRVVAAVKKAAQEVREVK